MFGFHNSLHFTTFHPGRLVASPPNPWAFSHSRGSSTRPADRVQGSGTAAVEAMLGTVPKNAKARVAGKNIRRKSRRRSERSKRKQLLSNFHLLKILCLNFPCWFLPPMNSRFRSTFATMAPLKGRWSKQNPKVSGLMLISEGGTKRHTKEWLLLAKPQVSMCLVFQLYKYLKEAQKTWLGSCTAYAKR